MALSFDAYSIAGLTLGVTGPPGLTLPDPGPLYAPFALEEPEEADLSVRVEAGTPWTPDGRDRIFNGGPAWSLHRRGTDFSLVFQPPDEARPLWEARADAGFSRVRFTTALPAPGRPLPFHPLGYPAGQLLVLHALAARNGLLVHAAGFTAQGRAFVFPGKSGAGKSTLTRLILAREGFDPFTDDRAAIREENSRFTARGTPWAGDAGVAKNAAAPMGGLFFLAHAPRTRISPLSPGQALERLLPTASLPWYDQGLLDPTLALAGRLCE
ncbi:MAG: hypothetical protein ABIJ95_03685, partial [Pseudomonadota bacterium]